MNGADLLARIRLIRSGSIGPVTFRQLLARFGSPEAALAAVPDLAARGRGRPPVLFREDQARREVEQVERLGARYLVLGQGLYPRDLAEIDDAPPLLIVKGDTRLLDRPLVAIVGAAMPARRRAASPGSLPTTWGGKMWRWCPASPAGSTLRRTTERWRAARWV